MDSCRWRKHIMKLNGNMEFIRNIFYSISFAVVVNGATYHPPPKILIPEVPRHHKCINYEQHRCNGIRINETSTQVHVTVTCQHGHHVHVLDSFFGYHMDSNVINEYYQPGDCTKRANTSSMSKGEAPNTLGLILIPEIFHCNELRDGQVSPSPNYLQINYYCKNASAPTLEICTDMSINTTGIDIVTTAYPGINYDINDCECIFQPKDQVVTNMTFILVDMALYNVDTMDPCPVRIQIDKAEFCYGNGTIKDKFSRWVVQKALVAFRVKVVGGSSIGVRYWFSFYSNHTVRVLCGVNAQRPYDKGRMTTTSTTIAVNTLHVQFITKMQNISPNKDGTVAPSFTPDVTLTETYNTRQPEGNRKRGSAVLGDGYVTPLITVAAAIAVIAASTGIVTCCVCKRRLRGNGGVRKQANSTNNDDTLAMRQRETHKVGTDEDTATMRTNAELHRNSFYGNMISLNTNSKDHDIKYHIEEGINDCDKIQSTKETGNAYGDNGITPCFPENRFMESQGIMYIVGANKEFVSEVNDLYSSADESQLFPEIDKSRWHCDLYLSSGKLQPFVDNTSAVTEINDLYVSNSGQIEKQDQEIDHIYEAIGVKFTNPEMRK